MCVIRSRTEGLADLFFHSLSAVLHGANLDARPLVVHRVAMEDERFTPMQSLLACMEVDPTLNPFEAKDVLGTRFLDSPRVFVFEVARNVPSRAWSELSMLVEHFAKRTPAVPLCAVAFDGISALQHDPSFDFSSGRCTHSLLADARTVDDSATWRAYLHHRCCWESGGDPLSAQELGEALADCAAGDDENLEDVFSAQAQEFARQVGLADRVESIRTAMERYGRPAREKARQELAQQCLLWRPPGLQRLELVPWASRALLAAGQAMGEVVPRLRHNLICAPLAAEILTQCLGVEAKIRMQLFGKQTRQPEEKTLKLFERFKEGGNAWAIYPPGHPSPPITQHDVWHFAGLGETLSACSEVERTSPLWDTVNLRNAVAHGHYVTWRHVKSAIQQARRFDV